MRSDEKDLLGNVLAMSAVAGFFHAFVEVPLHEYGHYWAASLLGVPMYIQITDDVARYEAKIDEMAATTNGPAGSSSR